MKNFKRFSEYLRETKIADRAFLHYTGKGFEDGHYVGKPCRWRDDKNAFSGFTGPSPVEITVPRGKPIKGVVWLEGLVKIRGGEKTFKVRSSVQVSAYCDFRRDSDNEEREIYSLHSMNVITRSEPSARPGL